MLKSLIPASLISGVVSTSTGYADTKDNVLHLVNGVLQNGYHTVDVGNSFSANMYRGNLRYVFEQGSRTGCRAFDQSFDGKQGNIESSICLGVNTGSHILDYPVFSDDSIELRFGAGVIEYSNIQASASVFASHGEIGSYSESISQQIGDVLYDPVISMELQGEFPIAKNTTLSGAIQGLYGMYTHIAEAEVSIRRDFGNTEISMGAGIETFRVHSGDVQGDSANTLLGGDRGYVTLGGEHCFTPSICPGLDIRHGISGVGEGNTNINARIKITF